MKLESQDEVAVYSEDNAIWEENKKGILQLYKKLANTTLAPKLLH